MILATHVSLQNLLNLAYSYRALDSGNDSETNAKCIPEETSEDTRTRNNDTIAFATGSPHHEVEDEISWADTLKCYSQSEHESYSPVEVRLSFNYCMFCQLQIAVLLLNTTLSYAE